MAGGFIKPQSIINNNVTALKDRANSPYTKFLDGKTPVFGDYYSQSRELTTTDVSLGNVEDLFGGNSPIRYNKIEDTALFGIEQLLLNIQNDEYRGLESDTITFESIMQPNTLVPLANDFFCIHSVSKNYFFKVISATQDNFNSHNFYKIELEFSKIVDDMSAFEEKQIDGTYKFVYANIGTEFKTIIKSDVLDFVKALEYIFEKVKLYYFDAFYSKKINGFICQCPNNPRVSVYDKYLTWFLIKNTVFSDVYLNMELKPKVDFNQNYYGSIYHSIELRDPARVSYNTKITANTINMQFTVFSHYPETYLDVEYAPVANPDTDNGNPIVHDYFKVRLPESIATNTLNYDDIATKIIVNYMNGILMTGEDIKRLEETWFVNGLETYATLPLVLYIIKENIKELVLLEQSNRP